ncbi:hypothetical protein V2S66_03165 [Streptomyces sp. V4-01]|uniref:DUF222 domain-containing protein n=1 Tax=Actinacidiphila polyblastidii TaxID=3110430 RepID=A0ABU7P7B9_9ACTN|nr:hypothetical protein [Streptomyces sp. V4-01]
MSARPDRWRSRPRAWLLTAAGCATVVGLAIWPRPTMWVLAGIAAGGAAWLIGRGVLLFVAERREPAVDDLTAEEARDLADDLGRELYLARDALTFVEECCDIADREGQQPTTAAVREWLRGAQCARQAGLVFQSSVEPQANAALLLDESAGGQRELVHASSDPDASGTSPETVQADPDASGQQPADQPGDDPDDLRNRVATALRTALRTRTRPALVDYAGRQLRGTEVGLTEQDLADVALAELASELEDLAALHEGEQPYTDESTMPTPAQWIWRWNRCTPEQRLDAAAHVIGMSNSLELVGMVRMRAGRYLTAPDVRHLLEDLAAALAGNPPPATRVVHTAKEQPVSGPQQVDESAVGHHDVAHVARLRDAVAEAIMCGDGDCLTSHHLPKIAQLLGGVGLVEEAPPAPVMATPPLTGRMIPTTTPTCGTNLPSTDGIPCGEPAAWHIRWTRGADTDPTFPAGLACTVHMEQLARTHAWYERHETTPACHAEDGEWRTRGCVHVDQEP